MSDFAILVIGYVGSVVLSAAVMVCANHVMTKIPITVFDVIKITALALIPFINTLIVILFLLILVSCRVADFIGDRKEFFDRVLYDPKKKLLMF